MHGMECLKQDSHSTPIEGPAQKICTRLQVQAYVQCQGWSIVQVLYLHEEVLLFAGACVSKLVAEMIVKR